MTQAICPVSRPPPATPTRPGCGSGSPDYRVRAALQAVPWVLRAEHHGSTGITRKEPPCPPAGNRVKITGVGRGAQNVFGEPPRHLFNTVHIAPAPLGMIAPSLFKKNLSQCAKLFLAALCHRWLRCHVPNVAAPPWQSIPVCSRSVTGLVYPIIRDRMPYKSPGHRALQAYNQRGTLV
jgi:hypothetical protein